MCAYLCFQECNSLEEYQLIIKNREELIWSGLRARAVELIDTGISRVLPGNLLQSAIKLNKKRKQLNIKGVSYDISRSRIFIIGGGKAARLMATELELILGAESITAGAINSKSDGSPTERISITLAGHPVPDAEGVQGVRNMLTLKARYDIGKDDLVICLLSGGGSSLMPCPVAGVTLEDKRDMTLLLLRCGAGIGEINTVRKHLSLIKGGNLGRFYDPARVVSLIISDVVGDNLASIASGPTVPDTSTFKDAFKVLEKYNLLDKSPLNAVEYIRRGSQGLEAETPKELNNCDNYIIGNNRLALDAMAEKARDLGLNPLIVTTEQTGDTAAAAQLHAGEFMEGKYKGFDVVLFGGETTPTLPEKAGKGGRNQHYAAVSMLALRECTSPWLVASVGTDGSDFMSDTAGAMVDQRSLDTVRMLGINVQNYIDRYDSNTLFQKIGRSLIVTGPTGTNVSDIMLYLSG